MQTMTIGKVASASGVGIETIRYYEREGLLPEPQRTASGYRSYRKDAIERLRFIRRAKGLGFSLAEIRDLLGLSGIDGGNAGSKAQVKALAARKLALVGEKIADLERMRDALAQLSDRCDGHGPAAQCPIIAALTADDEPLRP